MQRSLACRANFEPAPARSQRANEIPGVNRAVRPNVRDGETQAIFQWSLESLSTPELRRKSPQ